jgi:ElaB/YqjD/DUF883 family membrane-anchored ribosome-binding protein
MKTHYLLLIDMSGSMAGVQEITKKSVEEIERTRGQNSLGRKRFAEGLKRKKEDLLDDARKAMEKANRDFEKADKEVGSYGESYHYKQAKQRFATADSLVKALEAGDVAVLSANHTRDPQSLEWLRLINGVVLGGRTCNGQEIVEKAVHGREEAILVHFPTDRYYVPPALLPCEAHWVPEVCSPRSLNPR